MAIFVPLAAAHRSSQLTCMAISPSGRLLVASSTRLFVCQLAAARGRRREEHAAFPARLRRAVRALLLCAHGELCKHQGAAQQAQDEAQQQQSGIWSLPAELLLREVCPGWRCRAVRWRVRRAAEGRLACLFGEGLHVVLWLLL